MTSITGDMYDALVKPLVEQGVLGVILVGLAFAYWKVQQQLNAVQEQRVQDALKIADAAHTFASALERNTETLKSFVVVEE